VAENPPTTVGGELMRTGDTYNCATEVIGLELDILGKEVNFSIGVGKGKRDWPTLSRWHARFAQKLPMSYLKAYAAMGAASPVAKVVQPVAVILCRCQFRKHFG